MNSSQEAKILKIIYFMIMFWTSALYAELEPASNGIGEEDHEVAPQVEIPVQLIAKSPIVLSGDRIYLADIAECQGLKSICNEVNGVDLGSSPSAGTSLTLRTQNLVEIMKQEFPNYLFIFKGPAALKAESRFVTIDSDAVQNSLQSYLDSQLSAMEDIRAKVTLAKIPREFKVRPGKFKLRFPDIYLNGQVSLSRIYKDFISNSMMNVIYQSENNPSEFFSFKAQVRVSIEKYTPVAINPIAKGTKVHVNDFHYQWMKLKRNHSSFLSKIQPYEGWVLSRALSESEPLSVKLLERPRLVKRGQIVDLLISQGGMKISGKGKAMEDGGSGENIKVIYEATKKDLRATVVGPNRVEVHL